MSKITAEELHDSLANKIAEIDNISNVIDTKISVIEEQIYNNEKVSYATENGAVTVSSGFSGYTDNVVIQGKTYKNVRIREYGIVQAEYSRLARIDSTYKEVEPGKEYTYYNFSDKPINVLGLINEVTWSDSYMVPARSKIVITLSANNYLGAILGHYSDGWIAEDLGTFMNSLLIIEGNHINDEAIYFDGIKSFGQDNGFITSYKKLSSNLLEDVTIIPSHYVSALDGTTPEHPGFSYSEEYIEIEGGCDYLLENINAQFAIYDSSKNIISQRWQNTQSLWIKGDNYQSTFVYAMPSNARYIRINLPMVDCKPYALYKVVSDRKHLPVPLRSLPNGVCDAIEKRGNKYVLVKKCNEITLNGSESIGMYLNNGTTAVFAVVHEGPTHKRAMGISDKFCYQMVYNTGAEHFYLESDNAINIEIKISALSSVNETGFIAWLQANPVTIVYELATPEIIDLTDIGVQVFEGETTIIVSASPVSNNISFDVKTSLDSKMNTVQDRLTALENSLADKMAGIENNLESCLNSISRIRGVL